MNLVFKIANLAISFIVATIETIVVTIIVSKILLSSQQCRDKPNYTLYVSDMTFLEERGHISQKANLYLQAKIQKCTEKVQTNF